MSKNLTRKGLALGAVVALGSSLFAGTPANANPTALFIGSAFGTSLEGVLGQNFVLSGTAAGATTGNDVAYYVEGVAAADLTVIGRYTTDLDNDISGNAYSSAADASGVDIKLVTTNKGKIAEINTDAAAKVTTIKLDEWQAGAAAQIALLVNATNVTSTTTVKVTPFLDNVLADNKPGPNEYVGSPVSIVFNKASELTATPTIKAPALGSTVKASVAVTKVNLEQFRATTKGAPAAQDFVNVDFIENGVTNWSENNIPAWDTVTKEFAVASASGKNAAASAIYGAQAQFGTTNSAAASTVTAVAGEVQSMGNTSVRTGTSFKSSTASAGVIRAGSGSVTARSTIVAVSGKSLANQTVTYKLVEASADSLPTGATITAGGKTLTVSSSTTAESIEVDVKTSASGHADLAIAYTGVTDGKSFRIFAKATGATATIVSTGSGTVGSETGSTPFTLTGQDSVATALVNVVDSSHSGTAVYRTTRAGSYSVPMTVVDQFGQTPSGSFRVVVTNNGSGASTTAINSPVAVSSGSVTVTGTDTSTADGSYTVTATLQKLGTNGSTWEAIGSGISETVTVSVGAAQTVGAITLNGTTSGAGRNGAALVAGNSDLEQGTVARTLNNGTTLTATITSTTGANVAGTPVTFSAPGILFGSGNVFGLGSITVNTDTSGTVGNVIAYSAAGGKSTITVTAGSVSKTQVLTWAVSTTAADANNWTVTAPTSILPGQSLKVSAVLKDEFGALINTTAASPAVVKVVYTGPGFVTAALPTATDADGALSFTVLLGAADTGTATVKIIAAGANGTLEETTLNDDIVANASIIIGKAPVAASASQARIVGSTNRFFVGVNGNSLARNVVVKVAGRTFATLKGSATNRSYSVRAPKGSHKVTVFVGGKLIGTRTIVVR